MAPKIGERIGLALLFSAGALAAVIWVVVFPLSGVGGHVCDSAEDIGIHYDFHGVPCTDSGHDNPHRNILYVQGGRDRELEFRVYFPSDVHRDLHIGAVYEIKIVLILQLQM